MKKALGLVIILSSLVAPTPASAQSFGELFPVANTRYDSADGTPRLAANGRDFFLFWSGEQKIRATRLAPAGPRVGHVVLDTNAPFDVAWTGEVFLAASARSIYEHSDDAHIIGRVLDAEARPLSEELALAEHGREPRVAAGPEAIVMVYRGTANDTRVLVLGPRGESTGAESWRLPVAAWNYAVAGNDAGFVIAISNLNELRTFTLDRQGRIVSERSLARATSAFRPVALATDGSRYLLAWSGDHSFTREVAAMLLEENGSFGTPLVIHGVRAGSLSAVWAGAGWSVSYASDAGSTSSRARVAHLDRTARTVIAQEQSAVAGVFNPTLAAVNERIMAAWNPAQYAYDVASVVELPLASHEPRVATYTATQQTLLATASSADATLMVWREGGESGRSIHTGVRTNDGHWTETELATQGNEAIAASDGHQFVVIIGTNRLIRLDERGRPLAPPVTLPGFETAIAWNGTHYGIISDLEGRLLTPSGVLSASVAIPVSRYSAFSGKLALASNGDGFLLVGEETGCAVSICFPIGLNAMRLNAGLQRIEAEEISLNRDFGNPAGVVWNGSEYVVAWSESFGVYTARVPASAGSPITKAATFETFENFDVTGIASMPDGTIAIVGAVGSSKSKVTRVAFLRNDGSIARSFHIDSSTLTGSPLLAEVPGGIAYVASSVQDAAPHHGTSHVMMAIARSSVPPPPYPPHVVARLQNGAILVDWSPSAGTLNGYRLEYRVDDGSWNELEEWLRADSHRRTIRPTFGTNFEIRMRAFNDGGASEYSATAFTKPARRRAAR